MEGDGRKPSDYNTSVKPTWCPGCGNFGLWGAVKNALAGMQLDATNTAVVWGIGCHGNGADFLKVAGFHGLHGRALPVATGLKLANHRLHVIVEMGDGDGYGIGGNHFIHAMRRNMDLTVLAHNNQIYGLTTGQMSPTSDKGFPSPSTPRGAIEQPVNPIALALSSNATFIARGFAGDIPYLTGLITQAIRHKGFALVDIFQPCVTFNKKNTYQWYRERAYKLEDEGHDPADKTAAYERALEIEGGERIALGLFYKEKAPTYTDELPQLSVKTLAERELEPVNVAPLMRRYV
ncbi:MAG: 2-oxoacid ferredoxin oxidoreductase [Actinobacteria bacterium]|nr:MAG: 2-oxoacid ferredoxin oxidoreductase [Actinomycetota bacterium]